MTVNMEEPAGTHGCLDCKGTTWWEPGSSLQEESVPRMGRTGGSVFIVERCIAALGRLGQPMNL